MKCKGAKLFKDRLREACKQRGISPLQLGRSIGMPARAAIELRHGSLRSLNSYRLSQLADRLRVSADWLLGRSNERYLAKTDTPITLGRAFPGLPGGRSP